MSVSIKPELTLSCLKESKKYFGAECPIGTFIVRLYWSNYSKYVPSNVKLDGVHLLYDNKKMFSRVCEFAITSIESLEYLVANCASATGVKGNWFQKQTAYALMKFRGFAKTAYQFIKPIKIAVQATVAQVKSVASKVVETVSNTAKSIIRRFDPRQPQSFAKCMTLEQVKYLFDRCPAAQKTQSFIDNYLAACDRIAPQVQPIPYVSMFNVTELIAAKNIRPVIVNEALAVPQVVSIDDITPTYYVPGEVQLQSLVVEADVVEVTENDYRQILTPVLNGKKAWTNLKNIGFQTGTVISGCPRAAKDLFEKLVKNCLKNQVSVSQLRDIIAAG
jgi:hypothetical protein